MNFKRIFYLKGASFLLAFFMVSAFYSVSFGANYTDNIERGDMYFKGGDFFRAYSYYNKAVIDYEGRMKKVYSNLETAKDDAIKLGQAYYKTGLTIKLLGSNVVADDMFKKAARDSYEVTQGYRENGVYTEKKAVVSGYIPYTRLGKVRMKMPPKSASSKSVGTRITSTASPAAIADSCETLIQTRPEASEQKEGTNVKKLKINELIEKMKQNDISR